MAIAHYIASGNFTTTDSGKNDGGTLVLTGVGPQTCQRIHSIIIRALGTITVTDIFVTKADGTTQIARFGSTAGLPNGGVFNFQEPIIGAKNDNMTLTANLTGATAGSVCITVNYTIVAP